MRTSTAIVMFCTLTIHSVANACDEWAAMVVSVNGYVVVKDNHAPAANRETVQPDSVICPGQMLEVGADSRAAIYLSNNSFVRLDQNTVLSFPATQEADDFWVELKQGVTHFMSRITQRFGVRTPYANAVVDGTEFLVAATEQNSEVSVVEGQVTVSRAQTGQQKVLTAGQMATVSAAPEINVIEISTTDTVDWAVYFPPVIFIDRLTQSNQSEQLTNAADYLKQNRPDLAIRELESVTGQGELVKTALASSYLAVGDVTAARNSIQGVGSADAQALQSLIKTITNQPAAALQFATAAVQLNPDSLPAQLALSYAHQANLNLKAALESAREASIDHPDASAAWIRLSEMQVAKGDIRSASKSVHKARQLDPDNAATLIQSGYIDLFNHKYADAETSFRQAVAKSSENPQARLGLGLVLLRQGDLEAGRKQMEFAVSLDPARSVLRSYLGRAYFEEKRDEEAATQWELAKQLDPQDPTAYFYEGVRKLYANDPIGAIDELETSRRLNDERSLYRSETLLQSDAASRSAALARAYDEVGYDQGVLLEGWNALREDPTNSEGHRLLADKYRGNSRYDAARASELLQSQLWQPLSAYPLQPQLTETGIGFVEGAGPQQPGYNEYHSLFMQDGVYGAVNGFGGSDGTWADDLVGSFLAGPVAVSLGQYHFESDGWRENSDQEQDIYSGFFQWQITAQTDIQFESRKMNWNHGSLVPDIDEQELGAVRYEEDRETNRVGVKHRLDSDNSLLFSYIKQDMEFSNSSESDLERSSGMREGASDVYELQYVMMHDFWNIVFGAGKTKFEDYTDVFLGLESFPGGGVLADQFDIQIDTTIEEEIDYRNAYMYLSAEQSRRLTWFFGLDYDRFDTDQESNTVDTQPEFSPFPPPGVFFPVSNSESDSRSESRDQVSPKLGVSYEFDWDASLRLAIFRTASTSVTSNQAIKATQFVGFNQLFVDEDFSDEKSLAFGYDQGLGAGLEFGIAVHRKLVDYPVWNSANNGSNSRNEFSDVFLESLVLKRFSDSGSILFGVKWNEQKLGNSVQVALNEPKNSESYEVPIEVALIGDAGWLFNFSQNYYYHRFDYETQSNSKRIEASWVTNVSVSKAFPRNFGKISVGVENLLDTEKEVSNLTQTRLMYYPSRFLYCTVNITL